jgi:hypothetical protein
LRSRCEAASNIRSPGLVADLGGDGRACLWSLAQGHAVGFRMAFSGDHQRWSLLHGHYWPDVARDLLEAAKVTSCNIRFRLSRHPRLSS